MFLPVPRRVVNLPRGLGFPLEGSAGTIEKFESSLAREVGAGCCIAAASGRMCLHLILEALDIPPGAEVIVPAYTDESVPKTLLDGGWRPVFVDVSEGSCTLDAALLEGVITEKTRAVVATHLFGNLCDMERITALAGVRGIDVIEDCSHAIGATYRGGRAGSLGRAAFFSLAGTKPFHTFGGGVAVTSDRELARRIRERVAGLPPPAARDIARRVARSRLLHALTARPVFSVALYPALLLLSLAGVDPLDAYGRTLRPSLATPGAFAAYTEAQAAAGLVMLEGLEEENGRRRANAQLLRSLLKESIPVLHCGEGEPTYYFFLVRSRDREGLARRLLRRGIDTGKFVMRNCARLFGGEGDFPVTERLFTESLQVPVHSALAEADVRRIAAALNEAYR